MPKSTAGWECGDEDVSRTLPRERGLQITARMQKIPILENFDWCSFMSSVALTASGINSISGT